MINKLKKYFLTFLMLTAAAPQAAQCMGLRAQAKKITCSVVRFLPQSRFYWSLVAANLLPEKAKLPAYFLITGYEYYKDRTMLNHSILGRILFFAQFCASAGLAEYIVKLFNNNFNTLYASYIAYSRSVRRENIRRIDENNNNNHIELEDTFIHNMFNEEQS